MKTKDKGGRPAYTPDDRSRQMVEVLSGFGIPQETPPALPRRNCSIDAFGRWARGRKRLKMEYFCREMRRKTGLLMSGDKPEGGKWNYDRDNRKRAPSDLLFPQPYRVEPDAITKERIDVVEDRFPDHFGDVKPFWFAVRVI